MREGIAQGPWERLMGGVVLGSRQFAEALGHKLKGSEREGPGLKALGKRLRWADRVGAIEKVKGERWEDFRDRHGDWGRDGALWLGRMQGHMRLQTLGEQARPMDDAAVGRPSAAWA